MISNDIQGYPKSRFPDLSGDTFDCGICQLVSRDPNECTKCGSMYCGPCIDNFIAAKNDCPVGCTDAKANVKLISGALSKIHRNLDIKCKYPNCNKVVKLCEIEQHESICQLPKCEFYEFCGNHVKPNFQSENVCSVVCQLMKRIKSANGDWKGILDHIQNLVKPPKIEKRLSINNQNTNLVNLKWSPNKIGTGIQLLNDNKTAYLKENAYMFRSVIAVTPMLDGIHYWEILADERTENELKIGISLRKDFNFNTAFCDYEFGYAYYGVGQLRHNSNSIGGVYGKKFKTSGVLGICLDMNKGTLSFALNGEYMGEAFRSEALKKGPAYAAVALLHHAGCTLKTNLPLPENILKNLI